METSFNASPQGMAVAGSRRDPVRGKTYKHRSHGSHRLNLCSSRIEWLWCRHCRRLTSARSQLGAQVRPMAARCVTTRWLVVVTLLADLPAPPASVVTAPSAGAASAGTASSSGCEQHSAALARKAAAAAALLAGGDAVRAWRALPQLDDVRISPHCELVGPVSADLTRLTLTPCDVVGHRRGRPEAASSRSSCWLSCTTWSPRPRYA